MGTNAHLPYPRRRAIALSARFVIETLESRTLLSAGDLDPTFGTGGKLVIPNLGAANTVVQPDGRILLASGSLERLNPDGSVDTFFGTNGVVSNSPSTPIAATVLALQSDGKIVTTDGNSLVRYNATGTLDTSFGNGGVAPVGISVNSLAIGPGGQIVVGGIGNAELLNPNGSVDTAFNGNGIVTVPPVSEQFIGFSLGDVAIQPDGKVLVAAYFKIDFAVWRFNTDGSIDTSFGLGGMATTNFYYADSNVDNEYGSVSQMLVQSNGQILVAGPVDVGDGLSEDWSIDRFNSNGTVDTSFGENGGVVVAVAGTGGSSVPETPAGLALQPDGKILIGGINPHFPGQTGNELQVLRYLPNGVIDPSFDSLQFDFGGNFNLFGSAMALGPDGVVITGTLRNGSTNQTSLGIAKLEGDSSAPPTATTTPAAQGANPEPANPSGNLPGSLDPAFGQLGRTVINDPWNYTSVDLMYHTAATAVQADGKILLAGSVGSSENNGQGEFWLERLSPDGSVDTTFGSGGQVETAIGPNAFATSILIQPDGKIVLGGATDNSAINPTAASFALARYNTNGSLDTTFGSSGIAITSFPGNEEVDSLALGPGGTIVAAGSYFLYPNVGFDIARYNPSGILDTSFNGTGMLAYGLGETGGNSMPTAVGVQGDGKIVIGSHVNAEFAVYRFDANGSIDSSFGSSGIATTVGILPANSIYATSDDAIGGAVTKLLIEPDGTILAAGSAVPQPTPQLSNIELCPVVKFNTNGSLDTSFGAGGAALPMFGTSPRAVASFPLAGLALQSNGDVVLGANQIGEFSDEFVYGTQFFVRQFLPNGAPDPNFTSGVDPLFNPPPRYKGELGTGLAITPSGNVIVAGDVWADPNPGTVHWTGVAEYNDGDVLQVTSLADDGSVGTLRWAVAHANAASPNAFIHFSPNLSGTISLSQGPLDVTGNISITGQGAGQITIAGRWSVGGTLNVDLLTLNDQDAHGEDISVTGSMDVTDSTILGGINSATGKLTMLRSTMLGAGITPSAALGASYIGDSTITGYTAIAVEGGKLVNDTIVGNPGGGVSGGSSPIPSLPTTRTGLAAMSAAPSRPWAIT